MAQPKLIWGAVVLLVVVGTLAMAWSSGDDSTPSPAAKAPEQISAANKGAVPTAEAPSSRNTVAGPAERSLNVAALRRELAGRADGEAEVNRILSFARFQDQVSAYGENRKSLSDKDRRAEAQNILNALPDHVARKEIMPIQAKAMSIALLQDSEPDLATRNTAIQNVQQQWNDYARQTVGQSPAQDPRHQIYDQQSLQIVQRVQAAVPDAVQQQAVIAQQLQALRSRLYDNAPAAAAH
ncbi:phospholipase C accessory protein PlcR [Collimonas fungivorans]|uniref:Phospholipase C accessory protein PlcR n=1 Tax=Collimonas fungivorans TaxID=158899 RepID=A0A127P5J2_9BURK|nr:phospholipase C accessory protein PlcR [Collimonas fungivorans]AMO93099.1 phospholipase C accessory protein PlcR [Collimonas fungivorans]